MSMYGTRYILRWESEKYNHDYKILIKERDYTGVAENKSLGAAPLLRRDDSDSGISGTSLEMVVQADVDGELTSLYTVDNKLFLVELYKNGVLIWTGYVLPEKYSEPYISVPYDVSVTASDGLGILKNIQYAQTGTRSIFEIIKYCCDQTSLPLGFEISFSLLEKSMSSMESVLHQATLNTGTFNGMTCYEVLEECMTSLDCFITQSENGWLICSLVDVDKGGYIYNNQGTKTGNGKREKMVLGSTGEDCYPLGSLTNEIIPASKVATFIYDYNKRPSFLSNYDFRKGLEGWIAGGKAIYSHSVNDVHFVNLSEKGSVYQQIGVEKTTQVLSIAVNYCSSTTPIYWGGNIPETGSFNITIKLTDGTTTKYLSLEEGWRDAEYSFPRSSTTKKLQMFQRYPFSESDFEKLEITADGFPFSGKLEIKFQDTTNLGNVTNHVTNVVVTHIVSGGIDVEATLVEAASENHGEVKIAFGDTPFTENADLLFNNVLHVKNGGFTSEWMIGEKTDSFLYTLLKSTCSRIGFPRRQLTGVIQGRDLHTFMLLSDKYSDTLFHVTSAALNLLADEMDVTLEQFMPYRELSGETIESARVTGGNTSEYRSSGENETRVYQSGAGVPMRIRDLSPSELKPGSVIEVDRTNVAKSGKATLQELLGFILETGSVWTEEKLKVIKGYILYLGEKIKAGDSDLWAGNSFEDYLDQPVRKSDDVKFNSVTSTDFESKLKGWIIDALGDAEFRKLILREGFKTADFIPGVVGAGTGMVGTEDFTTGKLTVRNYMEVMALAVAQVFWRGGRDVHSPSGMKVNKVKEYPDYWRCYMDTSEGQVNTCTIGAQMRCDNYGDNKKKYYWNLVTGVGEDYIDLSKTDRDGVDIPEVGDELAQFGHRTDPNLSWILVISSMMEDAGMTMYAGVNSYTLSGKWAISMGKDPNGSNRVGVFTKNGEFSDIIEGLEEKIQDAIVKTIDITASSQVFKYGPGFTGNPIPATITLTAIASKIAPESYQWQFLHGTGWVNIESATKKTLDVMPGDPVLFPSGTNVRSFRCVCNGDESFTDVFTLAKLADGAAGEPGTDGKGISSTAVTYQASTNGTTVPTGTWETTIPSVSANQYLWTRTIITYTDGTTSTSYSIGKIGATGATGAAGKGIKSTAVTYQASTSGTTVPTGTWGTTIPSVSANQYLWTRTIITYTDNTTSTSYSIGKMGANGVKGDKGDAGRGISSTAVTYQASTNGTTVPSGTWETAIPSVSANQYLWTRTIITYTDGTTSTSYSIGKIGATGATGAAGKGIKSTAVTYQASTSGTTVPTGTWGATIPSVSANQYLWTRMIITYTDNTTSTSYSIGKMGATGATGAAGKDAYTVLLTNEAHAFAGSTAAALAGSTTCGVIAYKGAGQVAVTIGIITGLPAGMTASIASNGTTTPVITFAVTTSMKTASGTVSIPVTVDGKSFTRVFSYSIVFKGATGDKGDSGAAGKGVKSTAIAYQVSSSGTTTPTGTWSSSIPAVAAGQYLWTRTIITYTDNTTSTMYSVGRMGTNGTNGNAGNGVSSTAITYQASTSGITAPTGTWSSSIPTVAAGSYLWTRTIISYTNGTSSTIYSVGKMGNTGAQGVPGESINGKMLYKDPEFKLGWNGVNKYSNSVADVKAKLVVERIAKPSDAPTQSGYCLKVTCKAAQTPGYGGVYQSITSRANAVFVQKIIAKIPVGYKINTASNSMGTGYTDTWLTPTEGTGKYTTYLRKVVCGATGTFSAGGHVYITGNPAPSESVPLEWYIASMTCFDQTSDGYADIEIVTKDSFAVQLGFTNFEALKANALTKGPLIKAGLINADVIDVNTLAANNAFIDKLRTNILKANVITANMISVIGFTFADNKIIGGKDFGVGPGVKVTSTDSEKSFKAYKDASNYISMYYNSASDWGLKGVVGGAELLKLGITNKLGPFAIEGSWLRGSNLALSGSQLNFSYSGHQVYVGSHPDMTTHGNAKLGTFMLSGGGYGGLGSNKQVALIAGAPNNGNSYAMAVTQGMLKIFSNVHIVSGVFRAYMTGTNPGITLGNEYPNIICLYGTGNRKKVNLYAGMEIGSHFFITSEASQGFDVLCTGSERFYRNGNTYVSVQSSGQDTVLVMKTDTYKWTACQLPINWLGTWNP